MTNEKAPERIFAVIGEASESAGGAGAIWATFDARDKAERYPGPRMLECAPRSMVEYVRADLLATVRKEAWQPIETAPKDSSWILAVVRTGRQVVIRWGGGAWEDDNRLCRDPIYWMPLKEAPALEVVLTEK